MRDLVLEDRVCGQPDGVEEPRFFQSLIDRRDRVGSIGPEEPATKVALRVARNYGVENITPAIGAVDVAMAQGAAFQHPELVEQKVGVIAATVEMAIPGGPFTVAMGRADRAVHVQNDVLQPVTVMEPVDPLPVQVGQRGTVPGQSQRLGLEPSHLRCRGRLCIDRSAADNLAHDRIAGETVGVVDILVSGQPPKD